MLDGRFQRGFSNERLATIVEPRVRRDGRGFYIMSLSENRKVYFEDYYHFLKLAYSQTADEHRHMSKRLGSTASGQAETQAYYRAKLVICDIVMKTIRRFYTDGSNFGVIMTPWCFGTVILEKIEVYRDRLSRGEVRDDNIGEYPYYVIRYLDEIYKVELLKLFDFPEKAFKMRWQYSELLRRYSRVLNDITSQLNSVLKSVKSLGS